MARYVDLDKVTVWHCPRNISQMREWAFGLPVEDVKPVVHAHWKSIGQWEYTCTNCGTKVSYLWFDNVSYKYCAFCGAKMDEEDE